MKSKKTPHFSNAFTLIESAEPAVSRWKLFLLGAAALVAIPTLLTGCRFGNKSTLVTEGYDVVSGYYSTEPASFESEIHFVSGPNRSEARAVSTIPSYFRGTMTNPVILMLQSVQTGNSYLVSKDNQSYYMGEVVNQAAQTFGLAETQSLSHYACTMSLEVNDDGSFSKDSPSETNGIRVRGRLKMSRDFIVRYVGDATNCQELRDIYFGCLTDEANCPNATHLQNAQILYQSFLEAGIISTAEIKTATYLRHTSKYQ